MSHWADVAFDGIAGALIGSAATIGVVVATIKHDSRSRRIDRLDEAIGTAHAAVQAWGFSVQADGAISDQTRAMLFPALQAVTPVLSRAKGTEPQLAKLLETASMDLSAQMVKIKPGARDVPELTASILRLQTALGCWFSEPDQIRDGTLDYEAIKERVRTGDRP